MGTPAARPRALSWLRSSLACAALGTSACWVPREAGERMQADLAALKSDLSSANKGLAEQRAQLTEQMQRADAQLATMSAALDELNRAARSTDADFGVQLERLVREVQELRGTLELNQHQIGQLEAKLGTATTSAPTAAATTASAGTGSPDAGATGAAKTPPPAEELPKDKRGLMDHAAKLVAAGKTEEARGVYRSIIKQWAKEQGVTDEAYFRLGDTYFDEKKHRAALQEFIQVVERWPKGSYADDAYFKIGLASLELDNLEDAQVFFNEITKNYKSSPLVKQAQAKLDEVKKRLEKARAAGKAKKK